VVHFNYCLPPVKVNISERNLIALAKPLPGVGSYKKGVWGMGERLVKESRARIVVLQGDGAGGGKNSCLGLRSRLVLWEKYRGFRTPSQLPGLF